MGPGDGRYQAPFRRFELVFGGISGAAGKLAGIQDSRCRDVIYLSLQVPGTRPPLPRAVGGSGPAHVTPRHPPSPPPVMLESCPPCPPPPPGLDRGKLGITPGAPG